MASYNENLSTHLPHSFIDECRALHGYRSIKHIYSDILDRPFVSHIHDRGCVQSWFVRHCLRERVPFSVCSISLTLRYGPLPLFHRYHSLFGYRYKMLCQKVWWWQTKGKEGVSKGDWVPRQKSLNSHFVRETNKKSPIQ